MAKKSLVMRIGTYLVRTGLLTREQALAVIAEQGAGEGPLRERFGRIVVRRGLLSEREVERAMLEKMRQEYQGASDLEETTEERRARKGLSAAGGRLAIGS